MGILLSIAKCSLPYSNERYINQIKMNLFARLLWGCFGYVQSWHISLLPSGASSRTPSKRRILSDSVLNIVKKALLAPFRAVVTKKDVHKQTYVAHAQGFSLHAVLGARLYMSLFLVKHLFPVARAGRILGRYNRGKTHSWFV